MSKYVYLGAEKNVGRFGFLRRGDVVDLTSKEERYIQEDKNPEFKKFEEGKTKITKTDLPLPPGFDDLPEAEQAVVMKELQAAEEKRLAEIAKANAQTGDIDLSEYTKAELEEYAEGLRKAGKTVEYQKGASRKVILAAIHVALGKDVRDDKE